jgi:hypothetical protein
MIERWRIDWIGFGEREARERESGSDWLEDSGIQGLAPSVTIGYKYIRMERGKRDARSGRERHDARFGGERRDARFGDSEWLEDSGVQGGCPFIHHRVYTHIYQDAPGGRSTSQIDLRG